jgi:outer membrane protein assembly factor BamA
MVFSQVDSISYKLYCKGDSIALPVGRYKSDKIDAALNRVMLQMYDAGYIAASIDSIKYSNDTVFVFVYKGLAYRVKKVDLTGINPLFLRSANIKEKEFINLPFNAKTISTNGEALLKYCENNGYPYARVFVDSASFKEGEVSLKLKLETGRVVRVKEIITHGDAKINVKYLYNYLGISPNDLYKEKVISSIDVRLRELSFISLDKPTAVSFTNKGIIIHLFINNKKASTFNGVVGILPNNSNSAGSAQQSSIAFTGDVTMHLANLIKQGEVADLKWRGLPNQTQELDLKLNYPFIFSLPVGVSGSLNLFKQDTSFINFNSTLGVSYLFKGNNYIKAFWNQKGSSILNSTSTTNGIQNNVQNNATSYGIEAYKEKLDYRLNPTSGYVFLLTSQVGNKTISGAGSDGFYQLAIKSQDSISGYIKIPATSVMYQFSGKAEVYFPFFNFTTLKLGLQGAWLNNPYLFTNDLARIGGIKSMRGFTDASLYTSKYLISSAEYRFLLERNSFISVFVDYAYTEKITMTQRVIDHPLGFGAGLSFETKAGIFSLNYAIGKQLGNPIDFSAAKIHFGFLNQF